MNREMTSILFARLANLDRSDLVLNMEIQDKFSSENICILYSMTIFCIQLPVFYTPWTYSIFNSWYSILHEYILYSTPCILYFMNIWYISISLYSILHEYMIYSTPCILYSMNICHIFNSLYSILNEYMIYSTPYIIYSMNIWYIFNSLHSLLHEYLIYI